MKWYGSTVDSISKFRHLLDPADWWIRNVCLSVSRAAGQQGSRAAGQQGSRAAELYCQFGGSGMCVCPAAGQQGSKVGRARQFEAVRSAGQGGLVDPAVLLIRHVCMSGSRAAGQGRAVWWIGHVSASARLACAATRHVCL